jgi:phosphonatase-like hydrolase
MQLKLAVLDMAGTTINDGGLVQQAAINAMSNILNLTISKADADKVMGIPKGTAFQTLCSISGAPSDQEIISKLVSYFNNELMELYSNKNNISLMPHTQELFLAMRRKNTKIYLNTGFERSIATVIVNTLNLDNLIDGYIASDEVEMGRPHPHMIHKAMELSKVNYSHQVMKIGDTVSDLYEGFSAGCAYNIAVLTGAQTYEELRVAPYTQIIANLEPVLSYFK